MLKRTGYIIFTLLLTLSTAGFVISRHYCEQILVSSAINTPADKCDNNKTDDCCHDEALYVVLKIDYLQPVSENVKISVIDVLQKTLQLHISETGTESVLHDRSFNTFPKPEKKDILSNIQAFLL